MHIKSCAYLNIRIAWKRFGHSFDHTWNQTFSGQKTEHFFTLPDQKWTFLPFPCPHLATLGIIVIMTQIIITFSFISKNLFPCWFVVYCRPPPKKNNLPAPPFVFPLHHPLECVRVGSVSPAWYAAAMIDVIPYASCTRSNRFVVADVI